MIDTQRLILRPWRDADRGEFARVCNTPAVMEHLGGVQPARTFDAIVDRMQAMQADRGHCFWAVERRADQALLGFCGIKMMNAGAAEAAGMRDMHEIGWRLWEDAWGQGYAREAATASLDHAFVALGAPRVAAFTFASNRASWGLMRRLGMTRREELDFLDPDWPQAQTIVYLIEKEA